MCFGESRDVIAFPKFAFKLLALAADTRHFDREADDDCPRPNAGQREADDDGLDHKVGVEKQFNR